MKTLHKLLVHHAKRWFAKSKDRFVWRLLPETANLGRLVNSLRHLNHDFGVVGNGLHLESV